MIRGLNTRSTKAFTEGTILDIFRFTKYTKCG